MRRKKLRIHRIERDNLVSNLRGEVGEAISTWVLWGGLEAQIAQRSSGYPAEDIGDRSLAPLHALSEKLRDEMVARLSELGQRKIGRLNFYFAAVKLNTLQSEADEFASFIEKHRFREKRNYDISHKKLPETWSTIVFCR